jgi:hypothetical protein
MAKEAKVTPLNATVSLTVIGLVGWGLFSGVSAIENSITPEDRVRWERESIDNGSVGREPWGGGCMSMETIKGRVKEIDWSQIQGSASKSAFVKNGAGTLYVFSEMHRLGTKPCPDVQPAYQSFINQHPRG